MQQGKKPLIDWIRRRLEASPEKAATFRDFMEWCLYQPDYGYYMSEKSKVGRDGDYYTSAAIGGVMGIMVARLMLKLSESWRGGRIVWVEWGGGTGQLAKQILDEVRSSDPEIYERLTYFVIEKSPFHLQRQRETLLDHQQAVCFIDEELWEKEGSRRTVIFSNELLDAFPVHRVQWSEGRLKEQRVYWNEEEGRFASRWTPAEDKRLERYLERNQITLTEGQTAEINLSAEEWIGRQAARLEEGSLVTVDYGDVAEELYSQHRMNGTLMCYRDHLAGDYPLEHIGEQDMTSHVNFSACIRAGQESGIREWSLMTQKQFLVEQGIFSLLQNHSGSDPFSPEARRNRAVRQLLISDGMSELFKVLVQTK
ncbi:Uncharacterized ACR, COG1565 [Chlamydia abortus]|uniref:Class I SAM-dependent methyltransferase n=1 Tax=Paenibacillus residui TaxID=629724 RepID=A0ABW3DA52_9BACL|nr:SAM-dependent methyltransferase [Aneurinibacillus sp. XH2]SHE10444.1 Uncharacterized ACR, COG1565 [Chlamydia abortus]